MMLRVLILLILLPCVSSNSTTHVVISHGSTVYVGSDGLREVDGRSPERVCKPLFNDRLLLLPSGHLADYELKLDIPNRTPTIAVDFEPGAIAIMRTGAPIEAIYSALVAQAKDSLSQSINFHDKLKMAADKSFYSIQATLIWFENGYPKMKLLDIQVDDWQSRILSNREKGDTINLALFHPYQFGIDSSANLPENLKPKEALLARKKPVALIKVLLDATKTFAPLYVGPPYAVFSFSPRGINWIQSPDAEALCKVKLGN